MNSPFIEIDKAIYRIMIVNTEPLGEEVDVIVKPVDVDYHYSATFMTLEAICKGMQKELEYRTSNSKVLYYQCPDLIVVHEISVKKIEEVIDCIFAEGLQDSDLQKHYPCDDEDEVDDS